MRGLLVVILLFFQAKAYSYTRLIFEKEGKIRVSYQEDQGIRNKFENQEVQLTYQKNLTQLKEILTESEAEELISFFLYSSPIPFYYVDDYCYARAHEMAQVMELMGMESAKIIAEGNLNITDSEGNHVGWRYHIAPTVKVRINGNVETRVMDPSLSNTLLTINQWFGAMSPEPCVSKGRFEWYDERDQNCVFYQVPKFYYQAQDLWQEYSSWQQSHLNDAYDKILSFL